MDRQAVVNIGFIAYATSKRTVSVKNALQQPSKDAADQGHDPMTCAGLYCSLAERKVQIAALLTWQPLLAYAWNVEEPRTQRPMIAASIDVPPALLFAKVLTRLVAPKAYAGCVRDGRHPRIQLIHARA